MDRLTISLIVLLLVQNVFNFVLPPALDCRRRPRCRLLLSTMHREMYFCDNVTIIVTRCKTMERRMITRSVMIVNRRSKAPTLWMAVYL